MTKTLGIDLGTQSLKTVVYDASRQLVIATAESPLDVDRDAAGKAEQSASDWLSALAHCIRVLGPDIIAGIQAIAVSGQQHGFVALDDTGNVLAPVKLWCDTATQAQADAIMERAGGADECIRLAGNPVAVGYTASKIAWLKDASPAQYERMATILLPHDYLNFMLTGVRCMECGDASGTGLLDIRTSQWNSAMLRAVDPDRDIQTCLPPLVPAASFIGVTAGEFVRTLGIPEGIPVAPGGGDNMMAAIGTGNVVPGRVTISLGTSGTLFACSDAPVIDPDGSIAAFMDSTGRWLPLLCTMNCTVATETIRGLLDVSVEHIDALADDIAPGADGLITLPFFQGERTPALPNARAGLLGLTVANATRGHMLRSAMEGVAFGLRFGLERMRVLGVSTDEIVLTGGGSRSRTWRQIISDVCNLPVSIPDVPEGAAMGAALQALWVLMRQTTPDVDIADVTADHLPLADAPRVTPCADAVTQYDLQYAEYRRAVDCLTRYYEEQKS